MMISAKKMARAVEPAEQGRRLNGAAFEPVRP